PRARFGHRALEHWLRPFAGVPSSDASCSRAHKSLVPTSLDEHLTREIIMKHGESANPSATKQRETNRPYPSRRTVLGLAGVFGVATPVAMIGAARALTAMKSGPLPEELPLCRAVRTAEPLPGPPRALTLAWNATSICTVAAPMAKERNIFAKHNLNVDFINF